MGCAERGLIDERAFGPPLRFGNGAVLEPAIEAIVSASGLGALLARGVRAAAAAIGGTAPSFAMHAKGLELPGSNRARFPPTRSAWRHARAVRAITAPRRTTGISAIRTKRATKRCARGMRSRRDEAAVWDALVLCKFIRGCFDDFYAEAAELWSAVTGLELDAPALRRSPDDGIQAGNQRAVGLDPDDDVLPARAFEPIGDGPLAGRCVDPAQLTRISPRTKRCVPCPCSSPRCGRCGAAAARRPDRRRTGRRALAVAVGTLQRVRSRHHGRSRRARRAGDED